MTDRLEDLLSETLRDYAADSRDVPGLPARVVKRGQDVRRRRRSAIAASSVVVSVVLAGFLVPRAGLDRGAPPATGTQTAAPSPAGEATSSNTSPSPSATASPSATPSPSATASRLDEETWVRSLPLGAPVTFAYQHRADLPIVTEKSTFWRRTPGAPNVTLVGKTVAGLLVEEYSAEYESTVDYDAHLAILETDGSLRRLSRRQYRQTALSRDKRRVAAYFERPSGGGAEIDVLDLTTGRTTHRLRNPNLFDHVWLEGWMDDEVLFSPSDSNPRGTWSWAPGEERTKKVSDRFIDGASRSFFLIEGLEISNACVWLVRRNNPDQKVVDECVFSLSPDERFVLTPDLAIIEVATGRMVSSPKLRIDAGGVVGWEGDAVVISTRIGPRRDDLEEEARQWVLVRCRAHENECERVATPELPQREIGLG